MKRRRIVTYIIVGVVVLAAAAAGVLYTQGVFGSTKSSTTNYTIDKLTTGDIEKSVTGTGTLASGSTTTVTAPVGVTIDDIAVEAGQTVKAGDKLATIDADAIASTIATIKSDISSIDSSIAKQVSSEASAGKMYSSVSGRVMKILCSVGSDVEETVSKSSGLFLLSTDSKMKVGIKLDTANSTSVGKTVYVKTSGSKYKGLVESVASDGTSCTVTFTDNGPKLGAAAKVYTSSSLSTLLGSGTVEINRPYYVTASSGNVSKIYADVGDKVDGRTKLAYIVGKSVSDTYSELNSKRQDDEAQLAAALKLQQAGCITADKDGTIKTVTAIEGKSVNKDDPLFTMLTLDTMQLQVSVDELDINNITVGQVVSIAIDAVDSKTYDGTVETISQIGSTSNGVTTYPVTITLTPDNELKVGMNATATIVVEKHSNVLLMPIEALNTLQGKSFVWLYTGTLPTDSTQNPGTMTDVQTGLSNDKYVEITSGLTASDQVVVVRLKSTTGTTTTGQSSMFGGMGAMGGQMPSGGGFPSGGFPGGAPGGN